jgi:hypothetical protein
LGLNFHGDSLKYFSMNRNQVYLFITFLTPLIAITQPDFVSNCHQVKNGTFYFYPSDNLKGFKVIRKEGMQTEIDLSTSDTAIWRVNWENDCTFDLKFIRKSRAMSLFESKFYNSHITVVEVLRVEKNYYLFKGGLDSISNPNASKDTMWLKVR